MSLFDVWLIVAVLSAISVAGICMLGAGRGFAVGRRSRRLLPVGAGIVRARGDTAAPEPPEPPEPPENGTVDVEMGLERGPCEGDHAGGDDRDDGACGFEEFGNGAGDYDYFGDQDGEGWGGADGGAGGGAASRGAALDGYSGASSPSPAAPAGAVAPAIPQAAALTLQNSRVDSRASPRSTQGGGCSERSE